MYVCIYIYIYVERESEGETYEETASAVRCDLVLHRAFRARHLQIAM